MSVPDPNPSPVAPQADDEALFADVLDALERTECQFWACDGPTLNPVGMVTCYRCELLARVRLRLGRPVRLPEELTAREAIEADNARDTAKATHRPVPPWPTTKHPEASRA